jgi:hypothetical protein
MRAQEFIKKHISEDVPYAGKGSEKLDDTHLASLKNAVSIPNISMNKANGSPYMQYRFGLAMANPNLPPAGAMSGDPLISAYTDEEMTMIKDAAKAMKAGAITNLSGPKSVELSDTNKTSAVAKTKRNQYGV